MNYLSTKDISKLWGISTRRVAMLAAQGRIKDSKQIDGRWFIPENAVKPDDPRKGKAVFAENREDHYIFPYIIATVNSENQIHNFTKDEQDLYALCMMIESGKFEDARDFAQSLISSDNLYVKLGALYNLPTIYMYLSDFVSAEKYSILFRTEMQNADAHKAELDVLLNAFNGELQSLSAFADFVGSYRIDLCSEKVLPIIATHKLLQALNRYVTSGILPDITEHELMCRIIEEKGYYMCSLMMHFYISLYFANTGNIKKEQEHTEAVAQIGISHNLMFTMSYYMAFNPETSVKVLNKYPKELTEKIKELGELVIKSRNEYLDFRNKSSVLSKLTTEDYLVISRCMKKCSIKEMASEFGLSESGMKKRLSTLYSKLGVKTKQELAEVFFHYTVDWQAHL